MSKRFIDELQIFAKPVFYAMPNDGNIIEIIWKVSVNGVAFESRKSLPIDHIDSLLDRLMADATAQMKKAIKSRFEAPKTTIE